MARRRGLNFRTYARRRWRTTGLVLLAMAGTLLYQAVTDKGHEPLWTRRDGDVAALAVSATGDTVYTAIKQAGTVRAVRAIDADGRLRWFHEINSSGILIAAGRGWVAIATPFPGAQLTAWREQDGALLYREFLQGNPRSLAANGDHLALALQGPKNPLLVFTNLTPTATLNFRSFVIGLAVSPQGRVAAGTSGGDLLVWEAGRERLNTSRPFRIQSVRLSDDGSKLLMGGFSIVEADLSGAAEFFDLDDPVPGVPKWSFPTTLGVGTVGLSRDGSRAIAVEERTPRNIVYFFDTRLTKPLGHFSAPGVTARAESSDTGGVALSPKGDAIAVSAITGGGVTLVRTAPELKAAWTYVSEGGTLVAFASGNRERFVANAREAQDHPYDATLLFDVASEPLTKSFPRFALLVMLAEAAAGVVLLAAGYAWERRR
jgi:hypothetical protein